MKLTRNKRRFYQQGIRAATLINVSTGLKKAEALSQQDLKPIYITD